MNNQQFRKLMLASSDKPHSSKDGTSSSAGTSSGATLGSRQRSAIPMTPRALGGAQADFARQLAERNQASRPQKKFRSSAPKGSRYDDGYTDRARERHDDTSDDRAERLKALEEALKEEKIDQETYDKLRYQIAGGDLGSTHLVKGLDFELLKRIRNGEDVYGNKKEEAEVEEEQEEEPEPDVDDEFDQLEKQDVQAVEKDKAEKKKGQFSSVSLAPGKKRTRDQILAEMKAMREAAKARPESSLGGRFKKIGAKPTPSTRIERDGKGREVMIIVDENGNEKRKVRKVQPNVEAEARAKAALLVPDKDAKPLGMEVPEQYREQQKAALEEDEDIDIFDDVGDDYDPLADIGGSDSDSDSEDGEAKDDTDAATTKKRPEDSETTDSHSMPPPPLPPKPSAPRNYFQGSKTALVSEELAKGPAMSDADMMAAIKRAAAIKRVDADDDERDQTDKESEEAKARKERHRKMLQNIDRDDEDMDMGFGMSRNEDEEDFEDSKVKLSTWGNGGDDGEEGHARGGPKRKRGPKKRKGDVNSAADVLRAMEEQKKK